MVKLIVLFRSTSRRSPEYDQQYNDFLMMVERLPGIRRKSVDVVYSGPGGLVPYRAVVEALFDDHAALQAALTSPQGIEAGQHLIHFAGPDAVTLFADSLEGTF